MDERPAISTAVKGIEFKTRKLMDKFNDLKKENTDLKEENVTLRQKLTEITVKNNFLEDRITIIKAAKVLTHEDAGAVKSRVNELLREVDKCINFLSKNNIEP